MGVEMFLVSTVIFSREVSCRGTPEVCIDGLLIGSNVGWGKEICSLPEPNLDSILLAACKGIESTLEGVKTLAVRSWRENLSSTALIIVGLRVTVR